METAERRQGAVVPYGALVQQFKSAPPGKLYCLHGTDRVFRLSLHAAAHALLAGVPVTLVDGTNRFDVYYIAEFARACAARGERMGGKPVTPAMLLDNIHVARAFTCYQMEATLTERLPEQLLRTGSPVALVFGLLDTFYDEQAPFHQVTDGVRRVIAGLQELRARNVSVLLASRDLRAATPERNGLFPRVAAAMDRVYRVTEDNGRTTIQLALPPRGAAAHRTGG